jgi:SPP1 family predicted phage head-tail adaptor
MLQAGSLNRRIVIQRLDAGQDDLGQPQSTWVNIAPPTWASIAHKTGLQTIQGDAEVSVVQASIMVRFRADVCAGMRVLHRATTYKILAVLPDEVDREKLYLVCEVVT